MTIEHDGRKNKVQSLPRSLYAMRGSARWYRPELTAKEHRNSITFRTIAAAQSIGRRSIGIDLDRQSFEIAAKRTLPSAVPVPSSGLPLPEALVPLASTPPFS
jgi:hypothetical protein